jgi:cation transport ATPase
VVLGVATGTYLLGGNAAAAVATVLVSCCCVIALADTVRPEVPAALESLRRMGLRRLRLLSGGRREVAEAVVKRLAVDFEAEMLPEEKIRTIRRRLETGIHQHVAIGPYAREGFQCIPPLGNTETTRSAAATRSVFSDGGL